MPTCLYCHEIKDANAFNREHVVPEAFGKFEGNFVLREVVCAACNKYFGDHLDITLARDSIEGLDRYEHGVKRPTETTSFGRAAFLKARVSEGFYQGAEVWWGPSDDGDKIVMRPFPQIGVSDESGGKQVWFPADKLPSKSDLPGLGFPAGASVILKPCGIDPVVAENLLTEKGYAPSPPEILGHERRDPIDIHVRGTIDRVLMRAVAKIAYNYLAFHYEGIARLEQFDAIRRYVRYDAAPSATPVTVADGDILAGLPADRAPLAHCLVVSWQGGQVVGQVQLFFRFRYRIVLADGGFVFAPTVIDKGHLFDPINRQIVGLTSDPRRGKPIQVPPNM
jgi:hypothetical protein